MSSATITKLIEEFNLLPLDDKEFAADIIRKQLIEAKRNAIAKRVKEVQSHLTKGMVKRGTVKDFYRDLESD
ncbi:MAG: hypothetical protein AB1552_04875 [Nitrospirota bacterium]